MPRARWIAVLMLLAAGQRPMWATLTFTNNFGANLTGNSEAMASFLRAEATWASIFTDNVNVVINADLQSLGAGILGSTSSTFGVTSYGTLRNAMINDATPGFDATLLSNLPTTFSATLPPGVSLSGNSAALTWANARALGLVAPNDPNADANMTFSANFPFDFDRTNGITAGQYDFEGVVLHELGHSFGFVSSVDVIDGGGNNIRPNPLDFFRFSGVAPSSAAIWGSTSRDLRPGVASYFSDTQNQWAFSTGVNQGDGRQASHWKANELSGLYIGVMDPTLSSGAIQDITFADIRALQLIGWDTNVPEPATLLSMSLGFVLLFWWRRRARTAP